MSFMTISQLPESNIWLEWGKIIIPSLISFGASIFVLFLTLQNANIQSKINKDLELEKHRQQIILNNKIEIYKNLCLQLVDIRERFYARTDRKIWDLLPVQVKINELKKFETTEDELSKFKKFISNNNNDEAFSIYVNTTNRYGLRYRINKAIIFQEYYKKNNLLISSLFLDNANQLMQTIEKQTQFVIDNKSISEDIESEIKNQINSCEKLLKQDLQINE